MLKSLQIKDYALIESIDVEFEKGLNIITGETGAGKSILIDAMGILLGDRATVDVVRRDCNKAVIEGVFDISNNRKIADLLNENDIDFGEELIIRREISVKGSNRIFLNDTPVNLNTIREVGDLLVDLHGQHEHQSLLKSEKHIEFLDDYLDLETLKAQLSIVLNKINSTKHQLFDLLSKEELLKEKLDLYKYQLKEIDEVSPQLNEEEQLELELTILENSEKLTSSNNEIYSILYDGENSVYDNLVKVRNLLFELNKIDKSFSEKQNECNGAIAQVQDIADFVRSYLGKIDLDPARLENLRERVMVLSRLKKKYGGSIEKVLNHREKIGLEINLAANFDEKIAELKEKLEEERIEAGKTALTISKIRKSGIVNLKFEVEESLKYLGISHSLFEVKINNKQCLQGDNYIISENIKYFYDFNGIDEVEFYISTNLGESAKPLVKVASGGEISRVMLALKSSLAKKDLLPLLIFDEIDTGVSGRIGQKVGLALKKLGAFHQIISITHLPQIAALADTHFAVEKHQINGRVLSKVKRLTENERVMEVAKLLSGEVITDTSITSAKELMCFSG
ncbi:MAG: DNA repair protein RecN [bacterium]